MGRERRARSAAIETDNASGNDRAAGVAHSHAVGAQLGDFGVTVTASQKDVIAVLRGRLTAASVTASAGRILEPITRLRPREVTLDGAQMTYCDGTGIGLIGEVRRAASINGGVVRFD